MAVARAVASSSAFLAWALALASALSDFFLASVVVRSASVRAAVSVFSASARADVIARSACSWGRGEHPLGLLTGLGAGLLRVGLGVVALPGYLLVGLGLLGPGLVIGQFEDLGDALTDFLVRGLGAERLLARRGQVASQLLAIVEGTASRCSRSRIWLRQRAMNSST